MSYKEKVKEDAFWNSPQMAEYFGSKPADPIVVEKLSTFQTPNKYTALDLGCGGGRHTELLFKMGFKTWAIDINDGMIEATRRRISLISSEETANTRIKYGTILNLPFEDTLFDIVITTGVLHQAESLDEYSLAIKELSRVTKHNGTVLLNIFTNSVIPGNLESIPGKPYTYKTEEGLLMTLLSRPLFNCLMQESGFALEKQYGEDIKEENTGIRSVYRASYLKLPLAL